VSIHSPFIIPHEGSAIAKSSDGRKLWNSTEIASGIDTAQLPEPVVSIEEKEEEQVDKVDTDISDDTIFSGGEEISSNMA
jgi:hypothetical protein